MHELAQDKHEAVRADVAARKDLPTKTLELLLKDPDPYVQNTLKDFHPELKDKLAANENITPDLKKGIGDFIRRGALVGALGYGAATMFDDKPAAPPNREVASSVQESKVEEPIKDNMGKENFAILTSSLPVSSNFVQNSIKNKRELEPHKYLLKLSPKTLEEVINQHKQLKADISMSHYDELFQQHNGDHSKMFDHYQKIAK